MTIKLTCGETAGGKQSQAHANPRSLSTYEFSLSSDISKTYVNDGRIH